LLFQLKRHGLTTENNRRLMCLSMFWHFLDVIWIGVYLCLPDGSFAMSAHHEHTRMMRGTVIMGITLATITQIMAA
jgi:hypothetical protein